MDTLEQTIDAVTNARVLDYVSYVNMVILTVLITALFTGLYTLLQKGR